MDEHPEIDVHEALQTPETPEVEETSVEYLGQWNRLISTTNWEKGRIIAEWREALIAAKASGESYSDEAWSQRVGNVSPQHVGRLRRVHEKFAADHDQYAGLFWSHFQAALDWTDAEMWLEGAVQSKWSVARMRQQRWEAVGAPDDKKPQAEDIITGELDEDCFPGPEEPVAGEIFESPAEVHDADAPFDTESADATYADAPLPSGELPSDEPQVEPHRPFENLPTLPSDLNEAVESFKLAIVHHRVSGWKQTSLDDVLSALDALKQLAMAPPED
ncbi:MAG: hypothetical protein HQ567_23930 [Candidatus Nealsonbacteria bacterium]|nr:hypothetical protein [Candidatus Nealsonbacteria bacterium]